MNPLEYARGRSEGDKIAVIRAMIEQHRESLYHLLDNLDILPYGPERNHLDKVIEERAIMVEALEYYLRCLEGEYFRKLAREKMLRHSETNT